MDRLRTLYSTIRANPDDTDAWSDWLVQLPKGDGAALAADPDASAILDAIAARPGWSGRVANLRRTLRGYHKVRPKLTAYGPDDDAPDVDDLTDVLADLDLAEAPAGLRTPQGYQVAAAGAIRCELLEDDPIVTERPIAIVARATDAETGEASVSLAWLYEGRWVRETVSRHTVSDARALVALSRRGAPVDSTTARQVVRWLRRQEAVSSDLPSHLSLERCGWTPDGTGFLWGAQSIGRAVRLVPPGEGERARAEGYRARGSMDEWIRQVWEPSKNDHAGIVILAALAAPLVQVLDAPGWTLDVGGPPGTGKSAALKAALSACGDPAALWHLWGPNWAGVRNALQFAHSVPCVLDDTKHTGGDWGIVQRVVYTAYDRQSQSLGQAGGGTQRQRPIRTIVLSTGESRIASHCADAGGAASRMLTMDAAPWQDPDTAPRIHDAVKDHHGHALPRVVQWLLDNRDSWGDLREQWRQLHAAHTEGRQTADAIRVAQLPAMLEVAATVARRALGLHVPSGLLRLAWDMATAAASERDTAAQAWECVQSYGDARPDRWIGHPHQRGPLLGRTSERDNAVLWTPQGLAEALASGGYQLADVVQMWAQRGWLLTSKGAGHQVRRTMTSGRRVYVYGLLLTGGAGVAE